MGVEHGPSFERVEATHSPEKGREKEKHSNFCYICQRFTTDHCSECGLPVCEKHQRIVDGAVVCWRQQRGGCYWKYKS